MYVSFSMVMLINTHFLWCIMVFFLGAVWKYRQRFRLKPFWGADLRCSCCDDWVSNLNSLMYI